MRFLGVRVLWLVGLWIGWACCRQGDAPVETTLEMPITTPETAVPLSLAGVPETGDALFVTVGELRNVPVGVGRLDPTAVAGMRHHRLVYSKGQVVRWEVIGRDGKKRWAIYTYDKNNKPTEINRHGVDGALVERIVISNDGKTIRPEDSHGKPSRFPCVELVREFDARGWLASETCMGLAGRVGVWPNGASIRKTLRDARGFVVEASQLNALGKPIPWFGNVVTVQYLNDDFGRPLERRFADKMARKTVDLRGVHRYVTSRDDKGREILRIGFGDDGAETTGFLRYSQVRREYGEDGNLKRLAFFALNDQIAVGPDGVPVTEYDYDGGGRVIELRYLGRDGQSILNSRTGVAGKRFKYDEQGRRVAESSVGIDRNPLAAVDTGIATTRFTYNPEGFVIEEAFFGADGAPARLLPDGCSRIVYVRDEQGRAIEEGCLDHEGQPLSRLDGTVWVKRVFDGRGLVVSLASLNTRRELGFKGVLGYAAVENRYDDLGRLEDERYLDESGTPLLATSARVTSKHYTFDMYGQRVKVAYRDQFGGAQLSLESGCATEEYEYDDQRQEIGWSCRGPDGEKTVGMAGYAGWSKEWDAEGLLRSLTYRDVSGQAVLVPGLGYAAVRFTYDATRHVVEERFEGPTGDAAVVHSGGFASTRYGYDVAGNQTSVQYLDGNGSPIVHLGLGYASIHFVRDSRARVTAVRTLGAGGQPIVVPALGYSERVVEYDELDRVTAEAYFGTDGKPTPSARGFARRTSVLGFGSCTLRDDYFGANNGPIQLPEGYASVRRQCNDQGQVQSEEFLDTSAQPRMAMYGPALVRYKRDGVGNEIERRCFASDGSEIACERNWSRRVRKLDVVGRVVYEATFGVDGLPVVNVETGCAAVDIRRGPRGEPVTTRCLGVDGGLTVGVTDYARLEQTYDRFGQLLTNRYFDVMGVPFAGARGHAAEIRTVDARGFETERSWLGIDNLPTDGKIGYATVRTGRDGLGRVATVRYVNAKALPTKGPQGVAQIRYQYGRVGELVLEEYLDETDMPVRVMGGYAAIRTHYDAHGRWLSRTFLDERGEPLTIGRGYAVEEVSRDVFGREVERRYLDSEKRPAVIDVGYSFVRTYLDAVGRPIKIAYFGVDGELIRKRKQSGAGQAWAVELIRYDLAGHEVERSYFDGDNVPQNGPSGCARLEFTVDAAGNRVRQRRFTADGTLLADGWAEQRYEFDGHARLQRLTYHDRTGAPAPVWNGTGGCEFTYDSEGRRLYLTYFDVAGKPMDAAVCYPPGFCGPAKAHRVRSVYAGDELRALELEDVRGDVVAVVDCASGACF